MVNCVLLDNLFIRKLDISYFQNDREIEKLMNLNSPSIKSMWLLQKRFYMIIVKSLYSLSVPASVISIVTSAAHTAKYSYLII